MRSRAVTCTLLACSVALLVEACYARPVPATPTLSPKPPTASPTITPPPTATTKPSPSLPGKPQLAGEIVLRSLPGVGRNPQAVAVLDDRAYVANRSTHNVSVIESDTVSATIGVGTAPIAIAADPTTGLVYVANEGDDSISFISGYGVVKTVPGPEGIACVKALDGRLYAGGRGEDALVVLDGVSGERIDTVPLQAPIGILALAVNPSTGLLYASAYDAIHIVDLKELAVVRTLEREVYLTLGTDPVSERFFASEYDRTDNSQYLVAYDALGQEVVGRVPIGGDPRGMALDPARQRIYVANSWTNDLSIIDSQTLELVATVPVGLRPLDVGVGDSGQVYVVNAGSDNVAVVDGATGRLIHVAPLAMLPLGMAVDPGSGRLFVACGSTNSVFAVQEGQVQSELSTGLHPAEVALSPGGGVLSVLNYVSGDLWSVSTQDGRVVKSVDIGSRPEGLAVVPELGQVYASDTVLDEETHDPTGNIELLSILGSEVKPIDVQVDPRAGRAYMVASNGVPGSNSGLIVYVVDLESGEPIEAQVGGMSMTDLALDPAGQRIFSTAGRFGFYQLIVNDASSLERVAALELPEYPAALAYNPGTHHLFIYLTQTVIQGVESQAQLWVLDSRGLGTVAVIPMPNEPDRDAQDWYYRAPYAPGLCNTVVDSERGRVYLANAEQGTVWVIQDVVVAIPPSPTPTHTPTAWPTLTPRPEPTASETAVLEPTCERAAALPFEPHWSRDSSLRLALGCPIEELQAGPMAEETFERGYMLWREADQSVYVLYNDGVWRRFPDRWSENLPELSCESSPPDDLQQPKRGFGLVWCVEEGVKEGLGWAVDGEQGYEGMWQPFQRGQMVVSGTRSLVYVLFDDGTYREYSTP